MLQNAAATATSFALATQQTWPRLVIPHFAERSSGLRDLARTPLVVFSPLVKDERISWETFSTENQGWTEEGYAFQGMTVPYAPIRQKIHEDLADATALEPTAPAPFSPVWQMSPVPENLTVINFDLLSNDRFLALEEYVDEHRTAAISDVFPISEILGSSIDLEDGKPRSITLQPIFSDFADMSAVVGHYLAVVEWERYFAGVLHDGANGVVVVLRNSCNKAYTFVVHGHEATFIGEGDLHDSSYDKYKKSAKLFDPAEGIRSQEDEHCFYGVDIFPSDVLKDEYTSADPIIYMAIVFAIMIGTGLAFFLYETLVQRRQQQVLDKVARTNAIVSSLFPETVRDRLLNGDDVEEAGLKRGKDKSALYGKQGLKSFLDETKERDMEIGESKPIADLFPHTTVGFRRGQIGYGFMFTKVFFLTLHFAFSGHVCRY